VEGIVLFETQREREHEEKNKVFSKINAKARCGMDP
jgi:hypothetical protein